MGSYGRLRGDANPSLLPMFHIGDVIRKVRTTHGWTLDDLGMHSGIHKMTISKVERGEHASLDVLDALAEALGCGTAAGLEARLQAWAEMIAGPSVVRSELRPALGALEFLSAVAPKMAALHLAMILEDQRIVQEQQAAAMPDAPARTQSRPARGARGSQGRRR